MPMSRIALAATVFLASGLSAAQAQTTWNLPAAYPADNPHSVNLIDFAKDVEAATSGKLKITVHANASLFKAGNQARGRNRTGADGRSPDVAARE